MLIMYKTWGSCFIKITVYSWTHIVSNWFGAWAFDPSRIFIKGKDCNTYIVQYNTLLVEVSNQGLHSIFLYK